MFKYVADELNDLHIEIERLKLEVERLKLKMEKQDANRS